MVPFLEAHHHDSYLDELALVLGAFRGPVRDGALTPRTSTTAGELMWTIVRSDNN